METPLLQTKLYIPPTRPELVSRPRLVERLNEGLHRKLSLISAPAGFGKTTLVSDWLRQLDVPTAWLSLDESDNAPVRFLAYFIAALQTIEAEPAGNIGKGALSVLQFPQPPPAEAVLTSLINEIATLPDRIVLVLDDYHLIEAQPIHQALTFLLDHLPLQMHLVITTRSDPFLPLSRLRARGQMIDIRADDLRFLPQETATFFDQVMGLGLSGDDITTLENRTEGWITGLQLTAIAIQSHLSMPGRDDPSGFISTFAGDDRHIVDYLVDEVLSRQPEPVQDFLLQTSILECFSGPLCDAVVGKISATPISATPISANLWRLKSDDQAADNLQLPISNLQSQAILEYLERANLFIIPLDNRRQWYRYHHLFADLLHARLRQSQSNTATTLHLRASEWFEQNELATEAVNHALAAEEFERAARLVEGVAETLWRRGEQTKLLGWLEALPPEQVYARPQLCIFHAWGLFASGQQGAAEQCLQAAEQTLDFSAAGDAWPQDSDQRYGLGQMELQGRVAAIRAFMASFRGDVPAIIQFSRRALEYLPEQDSAWRSSAAIALGDAHSFNGDLVEANRARAEAVKASKATGNIYLILIASLKLAVTQRGQGQLQRVIEICRQQLKLANENGLSQTAMVGWLFAIWGEVLAELNDLDGATQYAQKGAELAGHTSDVAMLGWSYVCLVRVLFSRQELAGAEEAIQKMNKIAQESDVPPWVTSPIAAWQARIWLAQDNLAAASQWAQERGLNADESLPFIRETEHIVFAQLLIAQQRLVEANGLLERLLKTAEATGRTTRVIDILKLQALAFEAGGDTARAMTILKQALSLAEPQGYIRIFVDEGQPMAALLRQAMSRGIAQNYVGKLLAAFDNLPFTSDDLQLAVAKESQIVNRKFKIVNLVDPLSERELEVLRLLKTELSGPEIARELMISLSTVRSHTKNIYGKLDVHNRRQAVARAKSLGLL